MGVKHEDLDERCLVQVIFICHQIQMYETEMLIQNHSKKADASQPPLSNAAFNCDRTQSHLWLKLNWTSDAIKFY